MEKEKKLTFRQVLAVVDKSLANGDETSEKVWDVLTALRGPDSSSYSAKNGAIVPIRRAALPKTAKSGRAPAYFGDSGFPKKVAIVQAETYHFKRHVTAAARALKLPVTANFGS